MIGRWISCVSGVWLCLASPLLAHSRTELTNGVFTGIAMLLIGCFAVAASGLRRVNTMFGLWALASPFALGYHDRAVGIASILVGLLVIFGSLLGPRVPGRTRERSLPFAG